MAIKCSKGAVQVTKVMVGVGYWNLKTLVKLAFKVKSHLGATRL